MKITLQTQLISKLPMRQLTQQYSVPNFDEFSKLPMRQLTKTAYYSRRDYISKLPMRQLTICCML